MSLGNASDDGEFDDGGGLVDPAIDCYTNYGFIEIANPDDPNGPPILKDIEIITSSPLSSAELTRRITEEALRWAKVLAKYERFGYVQPQWTIVASGTSFGC